MIVGVAAGAVLACGAATLSAAPAGADELSDLIGALITGSAAALSDDGGSPSPTGPAPQNGPSSNGVVGIDVTVSNWVGRKLGPNLYTFGDSGYFTPRVRHTARTSSGGTNSSDSCRIELQVIGPQSSGVVKTANCSDSWNMDRITQTGSYTAVVVDRVSGRKGTSTFVIE